MRYNLTSFKIKIETMTKAFLELSPLCPRATKIGGLASCLAVRSRGRGGGGGGGARGRGSRASRGRNAEARVSLSPFCKRRADARLMYAAGRQCSPAQQRVTLLRRDPRRWHRVVGSPVKRGSGGPRTKGPPAKGRVSVIAVRAEVAKRESGRPSRARNSVVSLPAEDGSVVLRGDPRRLHPRAAVPLRDQPHLPLLLQVPHLLRHRDGERGPAHAPHVPAARQRQELPVSTRPRSILLCCHIPRAHSRSSPPPSPRFSPPRGNRHLRRRRLLARFVVFFFFLFFPSLPEGDGLTGVAAVSVGPSGIY